LVVASAGGYPADFSFYQSMKVLTNSARACEEGGVLIVMSQCSSGWGISREYLKLFKLPLPKLAEHLFDDFNMEKMAVFMALNIIENYHIYLFSSLPGNEIKEIGITPITCKDSLIDLISSAGRQKSVLFIKRASYVLPRIKTHTRHSEKGLKTWKK